MSLEVNEDVFSFWGVLGRKDHFWIQVRLVCICSLLALVPIAMIAEGQKTYGSNLSNYGYILALILGLVCIVLSFCALWKRVRDIRGTYENEGWAIVIYTFIALSMYNPVASGLYGIPLTLFIFLKKGVVTSPEAIRLEEIHSRICRVFRP